MKIFPGNYVNHLSSIRGQSVVAAPGRIVKHVIGFAKITASATSWDITIPSDDKRQGGDKTRPDTIGLVIPNGACLYRVGLRVVDRRKDKAYGTAFSGLVGTNTQELKLASALNVDPAAAIAAGAASSPALTVASTTIAPSAAAKDALINGGVITNAELTLRLFNGTTADAEGAGISSSLIEGSYVIAEAVYALRDEVPHEDVFGGFPSITEG
jgi:hypothetical protein